ncbi:hypothetical protein [uncultured Methanobacterium sp.]|uniref:hypothetical protein n=1 Tax=uncultured Methanobacterium sp. TaxID=176306 RepID=UPI002AA72B97|nr:hypothetical protein [uncultured Methanobacterium sp.]
MGVNPVNRELVVNKDIGNVRIDLVKGLKSMKGKITTSDENFIECDFGSLFKSRMLGEFFVNKNTLPRRALINLEKAGENRTMVKIFIKDTHKYGVKIGYNGKYEEALRDDFVGIMNILQ